MSLPDDASLVVSVPGTLQQTQHVVYPASDMLFTDQPRSSIVQLSLAANQDFLTASTLCEHDPRRAQLLAGAIAKRLDEKRQWLAQQPPDLLGAFQADLAMASYHNQAGDMVRAFDLLMAIRAAAPPGSRVHNMALCNLMGMRQAVSAFIESTHWSNPATTAEYARLRAFWVMYTSLPDE